MKVFLSLFLVVGLVSTSNAQNIVFGSAQRLTVDSDVSLNGDLLYAYNFTAAPVTINTVTFDNVVQASGAGSAAINLANAQNFGGAGEITSSTSPVGLNNVNSTAFNGNTAAPSPSPFSALSADYQELVNGATFAAATTTDVDVMLNGLTVMNEYEVQIWAHDARNLAVAREMTITSGANSVLLDYNDEPTVSAVNGNNNGGVGQFVIGTFTATSATETFSLSVPTGQGGLQLNAIQVRDITTTFVLGDADMNGVVNILDITPFIAILSAGDFQLESDIDGNGIVNILDITPFIALLSM